MKILFIVPSYKPAYKYGGTIVVTAMLAEQLVKLGHHVTVFTTTANGKSELDVEAGKDILVDGVVVRYFKRLTGDHTHASPSLWRHLNKTVRDFDVVHIHSWWSLLVIAAAWICKRNGITPVLSSHGMFSDYILTTRNSALKRLMQNLGGLRLLRNTRLHVSTEMELNEARRIIPDWSAAVIPNLVMLPERIYRRPVNGTFTIGFFSRIDPKKGLDILIRALSKVSFSYKLLVAGSGEKEYIERLQQIAEGLGVSDKIEWIGWKNGEEKFEFLSQLDLFALTSHSENFALVVIEALSVGTPVLISDQVGLFDYVREIEAGWVCSTNVDEVAANLTEIWESKVKLHRINSDAPVRIKHDFDYATLADRYVEFYTEINGAGLST